MRGARAAAAISVLAAAVVTRRVEAHQSSATFGDVAREAREAREAGSGDSGTIIWRLRVRTVDLAAALKSQAEFAGPPKPGGGSEPARAYLDRGLQVTAGSAACAPEGSTLAPDPAETEPTFLFIEHFRCPPGETTIRLRYDLFFEIDRFHESFTRLALASSPGENQRDAALSTVVFREELREITVGAGEEPSVWRSAIIYLRLGIFHILTGYDHLSFLMALLLGAALIQRTRGQSVARAASVRQALRGTVTVISAFTVAHSITLMLQVLRPGWISTRWVEPAIAFSVAYVGFENLIPRPPRRRWLLVFGFGLIHGLGFASVLREIGLPRRGLVLSLVSFNLGVEVGQLLVLGLTFPLIVGAARRDPRKFERWGLRLGSGLIAGFGTVWLIARLASR